MGEALPFIALGLTALSTVSSISGQQQQASAARASAQYQQQVAENNVILAQRAAADAQKRGEIAAQQRALQTRQILGKEATALAANGVDVGFGSAVDIQGDTAAAGKLDELTIKNNAEREAMGYIIQGNNYQSQADLAGMSANAASSAGRNALVGGLLSGAGALAEKWYKFDKAGAFNFGSSGGGGDFASIYGNSGNSIGM